MTKTFSFSECYAPASACLEAAVLLSNDYCDLYMADAGAIISFICSAYGREDAIEPLKKLILVDLDDIVTSNDCLVLLTQNVNIGKDIKLPAQHKSRIMYEFNSMVNRAPVDPEYHCLNYSFVRTYDAKARYAELSTASVCGNISVVRQVGIMQALGIGCRKNTSNAIRRFKQCAMWGDICSMYLLEKLHTDAGREREAKTAHDLAALSEAYLKEGVTVLPAEAQKNSSQEAVELYNCISSIYYDLVIRSHSQDIDFSFVEALLHTSDYTKRMAHINNYTGGLWKDETHPTSGKRTAIGFRG